MSSQSERIFKWDNLKFILILLVVIGHFVESYKGNSSFFKGLFTFIYSFHMPLFIFIAGYFHKNEKIIEKISFYILACLILKSSVFMEKVFFGENPKLNVFIMPDISWFMFAMAAFIGFAYLMRKTDSKFVLIMSVIIACIAGYDRSINDFLASSRIIVYFPYYIAGILVHNNNNLFCFDSDTRKKWICCLLVVAWFLVCILLVNYSSKLTSLFTGRHPYSDKYYYWGPIFRIISYAIVVIESYALVIVTPPNYIPVISGIGAKTLQIYFWHKIFLNGMLHFGVLNICSSFFGKVIYLVLAVAMVFALSYNVFEFPIKYLKKYLL